MQMLEMREQVKIRYKVLLQLRITIRNRKHRMIIKNNN